MAAVCSSYTSHQEATQAVRRLLDAGLPGAQVRVLSGQVPRDVSTEPEGQFAKSIGPDEVVGDFADTDVRRAEGMGTFAGDAAAQREGSFADADREIVTSYPGGVEHQRVAGHRQVRDILRDAGLDPATVERDAEALHRGKVLVLADTGDRDPDAVRGLLDDHVHGSSDRAAQ